MERVFPDAVSVSGSTKESERQQAVDDFRSGRAKVLITKPKILGFGLNLQICTRQIFSGIKDSYEEFYQAVKRSNRVGSTKPLDVHIPVTELEVPFVENVLRKADRVEADTKEQETIFQEMSR
jgi:superfamily II DNA or RNA helicase